jgi:hypothetical protein
MAGASTAASTATAGARRKRFITALNTNSAPQLRLAAESEAAQSTAADRWRPQLRPPSPQIRVTLTAFGPFGPASSS